MGDWSYLHTRETGVTDSPTAGARTTRGRIALEDFSGSRPRLLDAGDGRTVISGYGTSAAQQPQLLGADRSLPGTRIDSSRNYQTATAANGRFAGAQHMRGGLQGIPAGPPALQPLQGMAACAIRGTLKVFACTRSASRPIRAALSTRPEATCFKLVRVVVPVAALVRAAVPTAWWSVRSRRPLRSSPA